MSLQIQDVLREYALEVENYFHALFEGNSAFVLQAPPPLKEAMAYSLLAGGKRLRPALLLCTAESLGADRSSLIPFAAAVEMVHTYSLIHDDLPAMDNDDFRRGKPTNHKVFGEALAILAGDALLTLAFQLIAEHSKRISFSPVLTVQLIDELSSAAGASGMVGGQVLDIGQMSAKDTVDLAYLQQMHLMKTAALIRGAIRMGAIAAGVKGHDLAALSEFGQHLGLAFQIQDDLLDVIGQGVATGKLPGSDERGGKYTYVSHFGVDGTREKVYEHTIKAKEVLKNVPLKSSQLLTIADRLIERKI